MKIALGTRYVHMLSGKKEPGLLSIGSADVAATLNRRQPYAFFPPLKCSNFWHLITNYKNKVYCTKKWPRWIPIDVTEFLKVSKLFKDYFKRIFNFQNYAKFWYFYKKISNANSAPPKKYPKIQNLLNK